MRIQRTVTVAKPLPAVFDYLSDFTSTNEWDPGTEETTRVSGDGGVGTEYRNVSTFAGRRTELSYVVTAREPNSRFALVGRNDTVTAEDTMVFSERGGETTVEYTADFEFQGVAKYLVWALKPAFTKLGNDAERGMRDALQNL